MWSVVTLGRGGGGTGASSPALLILLTPVPWKLQAPSAPQPPCQARLSIPLSLCAPCAWTCGPGHTSSLGSSCGFQLFEAAVVASSKRGCGSVTDETRGAIYSGWPWAWSRAHAWGGSATPRQGPAQWREMKCWVSAFRWVGSFGTAWFGP